MDIAAFAQARASVAGHCNGHDETAPPLPALCQPPGTYKHMLSKQRLREGSTRTTCTSASSRGAVKSPKRRMPLRSPRALDSAVPSARAAHAHHCDVTKPGDTSGMAYTIQACQASAASPPQSERILPSRQARSTTAYDTLRQLQQPAINRSHPPHTCSLPCI